MTAPVDLDMSQQEVSSKWEMILESRMIALTEIRRTVAAGMNKTSWRAIQAP